MYDNFADFYSDEFGATTSSFNYSPIYNSRLEMLSREELIEELVCYFEFYRENWTLGTSRQDNPRLNG